MEVYYPLNSFRLCIDQCDEESLTGRVFSPLYETELTVNDFTTMVLNVDRLFDKYDYPKSYQQKRSFNKNDLIIENDKIEVKYSVDKIICKKGQLATFDIIVASRQHSNWQGLVKDINGKIVFRFSSELLLIEFLLNCCV